MSGWHQLTRFADNASGSCGARSDTKKYHQCGRKAPFVGIWERPTSTKRCWGADYGSRSLCEKHAREFAQRWGLELTERTGTVSSAPAVSGGATGGSAT